MGKFLGLVLGVIFLAVILFGISTGVTLISGRLLKEMNAQVAASLVVFVASTWFALWNFQKTKEKEAESRHFVERAKIYDKLVKFLQYFHFQSKGWVPKRDEEDVARELGELRYEMIIWGGKDTIRAIMKLEDFSPDSDPGMIFSTISNLYGAIRKDLGHKDDKQLFDDLVLQQIFANERNDAQVKMHLSRKK
jgi:hypothetical protein